MRNIDATHISKLTTAFPNIAAFVNAKDRDT